MHPYRRPAVVALILFWMVLSSRNTGTNNLCHNAVIPSDIVWEDVPFKKTFSDGFHPVYVYSRAISEVQRQYSQAKQDLLVISLLKANNAKNISSDVPFFVDLAANDALKFSNTYLLERNGWNGVCIEPNPQYWYRLASFRNCIIVGAFVGGKEEEDGKEVDVILSNGVYGGIVAEGMDNTDKREEKRNVVSISTVFKKANVPRIIDYFSLDVEGAELFVMEHFPWHLYKFRFMSIERPNVELQELLNLEGYKMVRTITGFGETLWIHDTLVHLSKEEINNICSSLGIRAYSTDWKFPPKV